MCFTPGSKISDINITIPYFDKVIHFLLFFGLSIFIRGLKHIAQIEFVIWCLFAVIFAGVSEIIQFYFIELRSGSVFDFMADLMGILCGLFIYRHLPKRIKKLTIGY